VLKGEANFCRMPMDAAGVIVQRSVIFNSIQIASHADFGGATQLKSCKCACACPSLPLKQGVDDGVNAQGLHDRHGILGLHHHRAIAMGLDRR
jgi:hypothetical protein